MCTKQSGTKYDRGSQLLELQGNRSHVRSSEPRLPRADADQRLENSRQEWRSPAWSVASTVESEDTYTHWCQMYTSS